MWKRQEMESMLAWTLECGNMLTDSPLSERTVCNETPSTFVCRNYHKINVFALHIEHCIGYAYCIYMWNYNASNDLENKISENTQ